MFLFFLFWRFFVNSRQVNCQISGCRPSRVCRNLKLNNHLSLGSNDWGQKPTDLNILLAITLPKATLVWSADVDSQVSSRVRSSKLIFFLSMTTRRGQNPPSPHLMIVSSRRLWARPMWRAKPISLPVTSQSSLVSSKIYHKSWLSFPLLPCIDRKGNCEQWRAIMPSGEQGARTNLGTKTGSTGLEEKDV